MTAAIFLVMAFAMMAAASGRRGLGVALFGIAFLASLFWFDHHMTEPLKLAF
jgi:hypothetical protein